MNNVETEYAYQEVIELVEKAGDKLDLIIIPKVKAPRDLWFGSIPCSRAIETRLKRKRESGWKC